VKKSIFRRSTNRVLALLARFGPGATTLRPMLHKLRGVRITGKVFIGDDVYLDNEYPESIEIQDGAVICLRSIVLAHTSGPGKIVIGKNSFIGTNSLISVVGGNTLIIGEGAVIAAASVVNSSVQAHTLMGGPRAKPLGRVTVPFTMDTPYHKFLSGIRPLDKK
jgi:acetyltransferase-like isoleucine patch superfamily enzyme